VSEAETESPTKVAGIGLAPDGDAAACDAPTRHVTRRAARGARTVVDGSREEVRAM
jgi:uncharacterized Zn-binding protein involved in type VI secretion